MMHGGLKMKFEVLSKNICTYVMIHEETICLLK